MLLARGSCIEQSKFCMITKKQRYLFSLSFSVSCCTGIGKNVFSDIIGSNADGNSSTVDNKVEKSDKFSSLNLGSPVYVYGFRS